MAGAGLFAYCLSPPVLCHSSIRGSQCFFSLHFCVLTCWKTLQCWRYIFFLLLLNFKGRSRVISPNRMENGKRKDRVWPTRVRILAQIKCASLKSQQNSEKKSDEHFNCKERGFAQHRFPMVSNFPNIYGNLLQNPVFEYLNLLWAVWATWLQAGKVRRRVILVFTEMGRCPAPFEIRVCSSGLPFAHFTDVGVTVSAITCFYFSAHHCAQQFC